MTPSPSDADPATLAATVQAELLRRACVVATAESLTGGRLGDVLSAAPGASDTYRGGVVAYATAVKTGLLGVADSTVEEHGVVSAECAVEMASGVRSLLGADYGVSTTGVAGPDTQEDKPVGLVFVAVAGPGGATSRRLDLDGGRAQVREQAIVGALTLLLEAVVHEPAAPSG